jgi:hypothetical protein
MSSAAWLAATRAYLAGGMLNVFFFLPGSDFSPFFAVGVCTDAALTVWPVRRIEHKVAGMKPGGSRRAAMALSSVSVISNALMLKRWRLRKG